MVEMGVVVNKGNKNEGYVYVLQNRDKIVCDIFESYHDLCEIIERIPYKKSDDFIITSHKIRLNTKIQEVE